MAKGSGGTKGATSSSKNKMGGMTKTDIKNAAFDYLKQNEGGYKVKSVQEVEKFSDKEITAFVDVSWADPKYPDEVENFSIKVLIDTGTKKVTKRLW